MYTPGNGSPESCSPDDHGGGGDAESLARLESQQSTDSDGGYSSQVRY